MQALAEFFQEGGPFMYVNLCTSVGALAVILERAYFFFFRLQVNVPVFLEQIRRLVSANNLDRAIKLTTASKTPAAKVAKAGLTRFHKGDEAIATAIEETLIEVLPDLKKRISALWSLANIATLLGLIGTIFGLIKTFGSLGTANPADRARMLSDGISEAMNNTALGLSIAVTCMVGHLLLSGLSRKHQNELDGFALKLENFLIEGSRKGLEGTGEEAKQ
jgi:biopolymer transport protein ExbB/TolQ